MLYIVAHGADVDGLACHSILEIYAKKCGQKTIHYFVDYQDIESVLENISKKIKPGDEMIIADIGYGKELVCSFLGRYQEMAKISSWFDHHKWDGRAKEEAKNILKEIIVDESCCASEIMKDRFFSDDRFIAELAYIARAHDFYGKGFEPEVFEQACKIQDVITSGYSKDKIIGQISEGILWSEEFEIAHKKYREIMRPEAIEKMDRTIIKYSVAVGNNISANITAVFVPEILESKDIRAYLMENEERRGERDIMIAVWSNGRIAYEARNESFRKILEKINENFKGGGRGLAGGATFSGIVDETNCKACFGRIIETIRR